MGMAKILYLQVNLVGMVIIFIMLMNQQTIENGTDRQKAFRHLNYAVLSVLILDTIMWCIDGKNFLFSQQIYWVFASIYYFFNCFVGFMWYVYISKFFFQWKKQSKWLLFLMHVPMILNTFFIVLNLKYPFYFTIGEDMVYARERFFIISFLVAITYIVVPFIQCIKVYQTSDNILERKDCALILKIQILPFIGVFIQILFYGISLIWISHVLTLLCFFINFQNKIISMDPLTQLNNRYQFNVCLESIDKGILKGEINSIVFIDIDKFKGINDRFGHVVGDRMLIQVSNILVKACKGDDTIVGRFGGDEFYIFCKESAKEQIIGRINRFVQEYNAGDVHGIELSLSIGASDFHGKDRKTTQEILELADKAMYKNKIK